MESDGVETGQFLGKIPYIKGGSGPKKAVVFVGGNALFKRLDRSDAHRYVGMVATLLPDGTTFHILGYEEEPPPSYGLDEIVHDLAQIMDEEIGRATVVGISFGGFVALRLAATHAELVNRLVLLVSAHRFSTDGRRRIEAQIASLEAGDLYGLVRDNAVLFRRPWYNWLVRLRTWRGKGRFAAEFNDPASIVRDYRALFSTDFDRNGTYAARIGDETLVVAGTADQFFDRDAFEETPRLIPRARLELFEGERHMLPVERRRDVARLLGDFLSGS
jgi:pimeloyl-ACP methyl ester carboxylesterase